MAAPANRAISVHSSRDSGRESRASSRAPRRGRDSRSPSPADNGANKRPRFIVLSPKKKTTDAFGTAARRITRLVDMNWDPTSVINAGISLLALDSEEAMEAEMASASPKKKALYEIFMTLSDLIPGLQDSSDWATVRHRLDHHKSAAKTEDNRTFKTSLPKWQVWDPPISSESKLGRGTSHPECARLLCPIRVDWNDEIARNRFRTEHDPPMTAENCPAFVYKDCVADPDNPVKGFLRSDIMVRAARAAIFPPSVANAADKPDHQSGRKSKAEIYEMEKVTPGFIAYVAVGVRYALSSESTFNVKGAVFNYQKFYKNIVTYLNDPVCKRDTDALLEWWNECLFPAKNPVEDDAPGDFFAQLRVHAEQHCALEAEEAELD